MRCIYFGNNGVCYAKPHVPLGAGDYKPEEEVQKEYCKTGEFVSCPRLTAIHDYLKASKGK